MVMNQSPSGALGFTPALGAVVGLLPPSPRGRAASAGQNSPPQVFFLLHPGRGPQGVAAAVVRTSWTMTVREGKESERSSKDWGTTSRTAYFSRRRATHPCGGPTGSKPGQVRVWMSTRTRSKNRDSNGVSEVQGP